MSFRTKFFGVLAIIAAIVFGFMPYIRYGTAETITATVMDKERVCSAVRDADGKEGVDCKYLIYTDAETFENTDTIWYWKFRSSDVYGAVKEGQTYNFYVYGYRFGWLSWYRNIVNVEPVNTTIEETPTYCGTLTVTSDVSAEPIQGCFKKVD